MLRHSYEKTAATTAVLALLGGTVACSDHNKSENIKPADANVAPAITTRLVSVASHIMDLYARADSQDKFSGHPPREIGIQTELSDGELLVSEQPAVEGKASTVEHVEVLKTTGVPKGSEVFSIDFYERTDGTWNVYYHSPTTSFSALHQKGTVILNTNSVGRLLDQVELGVSVADATLSRPGTTTLMSPNGF